MEMSCESYYMDPKLVLSRQQQSNERQNKSDIRRSSLNSSSDNILRFLENNYQQCPFLNKFLHH